MDHKVSKDMISSGMIPSGEKTQADLGRTQYGSTPSPSSLMEAYRSIYEHHQKDENGNTIPHEGEELNEALPLAPLAVAAGMTGASIYGANLLRKSLKKDKPTEGKPEVKPSKPSKPVPQMNDVDLFDLVKGKLIDEGCDEQEAIKIMVNASQDELQQIAEMDRMGGPAAIAGILGAGMFGAKKVIDGVKGMKDKLQQKTKEKNKMMQGM